MKTKPARLKKRRDFIRIQRSGFRFKGQFLVITSRQKFDRSQSGHFGIVTPKAIGKAHERNFIKRRLRHIVGLVPELLKAHDVVFLASQATNLATFEQLKADVMNASSSMSTSPPRQIRRNDKRSFVPKSHPR